jgi:glycosyltransferase involved in cell wall biosynthesis
MTSIIIPAHNEETVIGKCLHKLVPAAPKGEIEVIVVCNGCSDKTSEVVRSYGNSIICIETPVASKTNALNLGDEAASGFPRIYLDADVVLSLETVRQVASVLSSGRYLAVAPQMQMDYGHSSWAVRSFYDVWQRLPYVKEGMIGTGIFALSAEGRSRFKKFPNVIADDGYIRALFKTSERTSVESCCSQVRAPADIGSLIKIKTRSRLGRYELQKRFPHLLTNEVKDYSGALRHIIRDAKLWPKIPIYLYVNLLTRIRAKMYLKKNGTTGWERDESSRF